MINYGQTKDKGTERVYGSENLDNGEKTRQNTLDSAKMKEKQQRLRRLRRTIERIDREERIRNHKFLSNSSFMEDFYG